MSKEHYLKKELYELVKHDERIFDFIQESSLDGLWYRDLEKPENEWMNNRFWTTLGYEPMEMPHLTNTWQEIIYQDDLKIALDNFEKHISNPDHPYDQVVRYHHKNGSTVWIRRRGMAIRDNQGKPVRMLGAHHNITALKQKEQQIIEEKKAAEASEAKYKDLYNNAPVAIQSLNENGIIIDINPKWLKLLGHQKNDVLGKWFGDFLHPDDINHFQKNFPLFKEKGFIDGIQYRMIRKDKKEIIVAFEGCIVYNPDGTFKQTYCTFKDITKEEAGEAALKKSEAKYRQLFETASDAIYFIDEKGTIVDTNQGASKMLEKTREEIIGSKIDTVDPKFPVRDFLDFWGKIPFEGRQIFETTHQTKNGHLIPVEISGKKFQLDGQTYYYGIARNITERVLIRKELKENESKFRSVFEHANIGIAMADPKGNIADANDEFVRLLCYSKEELLEMNFADFTHPDDLNKEKSLINQLVNKEIPGYRIEKRYINKHGDILWVDIAVTNRLNSKGENDMSIGMIMDITSKKKFEENLAESEEKYRVLAETAKQIIIVHKLNGEITYINEYGANFIDTTKENIIGQNINHFITREEVEEQKHRIKEFMDGKIAVHQFVMEFVNSRSETRYLELVGSPIKKGNQIDSILILAYDVTERIEAEKALKARESLFNNVLSTIPDMVSIHNADLNIIFSNWNGFGAVPKEKRKLYTKCYKTYRGYNQVCPDCQAKTVLETKKPYHSEVKLPDERWFDIRVLPIPNEEHQYTMFVEWVRDITDMKRSEVSLKEKNEEYESVNEELIQANKELTIAKTKAEESDQLKTEFLNNMSHEIRTPLNGIIGFTQMLDRQNITHEKRKYFSKIIQNSSDQLMKIIDDILEISRLETKQMELYEEEFCLNDVLMNLYSVFNVKSQEKKVPVYIKKSLTDDQSRILNDRAKLDKILSNLIDNALKYTDDGFIEIGYEIKQEYLEIYVKDTGIGISPENKDIIFERFSQEEKEISRKHDGLGLGLSISKGNALLLGGNITFTSQKGRGTTFFVSIPYKSSIGMKKTIDDIPENKQSNNNSAEYTILVAEDEEINYLFLEELFEDEPGMSYKMLHAKNGQEAVDICKEHDNIDMILMDIKMPVMNGLEASQKIKSFRPELPIIAQTAYHTESDRKLALDAGCVAFLSKPVQSDELFRLVRKLLQEN